MDDHQKESTLLLTNEAKKILIVVKERVLAEPGRLDMRAWTVDPGNDEFDDEFDNVTAGDYRPPCNTVGCAAGNVIVVDMLMNHGFKPAIGENMLGTGTVNEIYGYGSYGTIARDILGLDLKQSNSLFYVGSWPAKFRAPADEEGEWESNMDVARSAKWPVAGNYNVQTHEYAQVVADRIQHFIDTDGTE